MNVQEQIALLYNTGNPKLIAAANSYVREHLNNVNGYLPQEWQIYAYLKRPYPLPRLGPHDFSGKVLNYKRQFLHQCVRCGHFDLPEVKAQLCRGYNWTPFKV